VAEEGATLGSPFKGLDTVVGRPAPSKCERKASNGRGAWQHARAGVGPLACMLVFMRGC